jgi:hypothetical protein
MNSQSTRRAAPRTLATAATALAATILASPAAVALCPNCLGQNDSLTPTLRIVGVFLLIPPAIFFFVARLIRRLNR